MNARDDGEDGSDDTSAGDDMGVMVGKEQALVAECTSVVQVFRLS